MMLRALTVLIALSAMAFTAGLSAQKSGQSARITVGTVEQMKAVELSNSSGKGALAGGAIGWAATRNKSSKKQLAGAATGAVVGNAINSNKAGTAGMQYVVRTGDGTAITIISDQTQIAIGDCVTVEEHSQGANIRRIDPAACAPEAAQVIAELEDEMQEEAAECATAKDELLAAETTAQFELAKGKMDILCNS